LKLPKIYGIASKPSWVNRQPPIHHVSISCLIYASTSIFQQKKKMMFRFSQFSHVFFPKNTTPHALSTFGVSPSGFTARLGASAVALTAVRKSSSTLGLAFPPGR
jgi:hypothetical protein